MAKSIDKNIDILWPYIISCKYNAKPSDVKLAERVSEYDVLIMFTDGDMYIYDTFLGMSRKIRYTSSNLTKDEWCFEFGKRLHDLLQRKYITERDFARMLKIQPPALNRYIQGKVAPSGYIMNKILTILEIRADDLLLIPVLLNKYLKEE